MQSVQPTFTKIFDLVLSAVVTPFLSLTFFLFFILGDTYLRWYLLPPYIVGLFLVFIRLHNYFPQNILLIPIWLLFLIWAVITTVYSHALSLSLDYLLFQTTLFVTFTTIVTFRSYLQTQKRDLLILGEEFEHILVLFFILIGVVLSILSLGFVINPDLALKLPGFNLLHASYGHNHLASYLILILPASWWMSLKSRSLLLFFCTVFMTVSLLTSFGRVAVAIGFVQLLFLAWVFFQSSISHSLHLPLAIRKRLKIIFMILVALFMEALIAKSYFSLISFVFPSAPEFLTCPITQLSQQLCKPVASEGRVYYWQQAFDAIVAYPIFGYGPGTFGLISSKYAHISSHWSGFAHNAYLQIAAELGLFGGALFLLKKVILISDLLCAVKKNKDQLFITSILIGLVSLFINNAFDFDWNFIGVAVTAVSMAGLAISIKSTESLWHSRFPQFLQFLQLPRLLQLSQLPRLLQLSQLLQPPQFLQLSNLVQRMHRVQKYALFTLFIAIFSISAIVLYAEYLFTQNRFREVLKFFPHVSHHSVGLVEQKDWSNEELDQIVSIYAFQPIPLKSLLTQYKSYPDWLNAYGHLHAAERGISHTSMLLPSWANQYLPLHERIQQYDLLLDEAHELSELHEDYKWFPTKQKLLKDYLVLANQVYAEGNLEKAADMYLRAYKHDKWALSEASIAFLHDGPRVNEQHKSDEEYMQTIVSKVQPSPGLLLFLREVVSVVGGQLGYNAAVFGEVYLAVLHDQLQNCLYHVEPCSLLSTEIVLTDIENIVAITPWKDGQVWETISEQYYSFLKQNYETISLAQADTLLSYWFHSWQLLNELNTNEWEIGYPQTREFTRIAQAILLQYVKEHIQLSDFEYDSNVSNQTITHFQSILTKMNEIDPADYAVQAQLGHFYVMVENVPKAQAAYQTCLDEYAQATQQIQYDCQAGLENIEAQNTWKGRFVEIGQVIISDTLTGN
jgi:O-antigen ligase